MFIFSVGKILYIWLFFSTAVICGCVENNVLEDIPDDDTSNTKDTISILSLGDSYTIGHAVPASMRFPNQLADSLTSTGITVDKVDVVARTGWATDQLLNGIDARSDLASKYDLVTLCIGVNNQYRNYPLIRFINEFNALLDTAITFAGGEKERVMVVSIPDYAYTPFGNGSASISQDIDIYNGRKEDICVGRGIKFINITDISREGLDKPELVAPDGLHPSARQYSRWVSRMLPHAKEIIDN